MTRGDKQTNQSNKRNQGKGCSTGGVKGSPPPSGEGEGRGLEITGPVGAGVMCVILRLELSLSLLLGLQVGLLVLLAQAGLVGGLLDPGGVGLIFLAGA
jgi:hypothetical protein